jgi:membrane-associated phospholipid phosphatase
MVFLAIWLLLVTAAQVTALVDLGAFFVGTAHGQSLDTIALAGNTIGHDRVGTVVDTVLNAMSLVSLLVATAGIGFIALVRRRIGLAITATVMVAGANITTQLLKYGIPRPEFGVDAERTGAGNSFPSGHATIAASVAVALVLVLPQRIRGIVAILGAVYIGLAGVATLSAGWHRPSDAVAATLVVGVWAALAGLAMAVTRRQDSYVLPGDAHRYPLVTLLCVGLALLAVAAVTLRLTNEVFTIAPEELSGRRLFTAYGGSAAGIVGVAALMMAVVLSTVHWVVPRRGVPESEAPVVEATP